ncbi:UvrD-helicase domain-containing protein [Proteinivorax hydrogeniformans]|uniref:DNA 3'-5' helicase n=1 Tax=Proteinivorax hydrogeniformans TaxID=1826727 RepID=A0AAU8HX23_9FIRM
MNFNPEQKEAIYSENPLILISAGAGSGKTRVLTERFLNICQQKLNEFLEGSTSDIGATVKEIVAITFTEKAAREMKERIRGELNTKLEELDKLEDEKNVNIAKKFWQQQKEDLDNAYITTFHSFCHKLLTRFAFKANLPPTFTMLDDIDSTLLQSECLDEMFADKTNYYKWKDAFIYYSKEQLKRAINSVYAQICEAPEQIDIKTFFEAEEILALQQDLLLKQKASLLEKFYQKAQPCVEEFPSSSELKGKLQEYVENISNHFGKVDLNNIDYDECYELLQEVMPKRKVSSWEDKCPALFELYVDIYNPLKQKWKNIPDFPTEKREQFLSIISCFAEMLCIFDEKYTKKKIEKAALDFSDLQKKAINLLENEDVRATCRQEFKHFMVDEFQDTNKLQMKMLDYIQPRFQFIVGDEKQSIYRFRGADVTVMRGLQNKVKQSDGYINMNRNYRNCHSIIGFVNAIFSEVMRESEDNAPYSINYSPLVSNRDDKEEQEVKVELIEMTENDEEEIEKDDDSQVSEVDCYDSEFDMLTERMLEIAQSEKKLVREKDTGVWRKAQWRDFAILVPSRTGLIELEKCLKDKNIPFVVHGGIGFFAKQEVKDMLALLRWIARPWESTYIAAVLRSPIIGITLDEMFAIKACGDVDNWQGFADFIYNRCYFNESGLATQTKAKLNKFYNLFTIFVPLTPQRAFSDTLYEVFNNSGLKQTLLMQPNSLQLIKNVEKLIETMNEQNPSSLEELLEKIDVLAMLGDREGEAEAELPEGNMVHIMTVHASKGLEFPIVCLPRLNRQLQKDSGSFRFDDKMRLVAKFTQEKKNNPFSDEEIVTPGFNIVKSESDIAAAEESKRLFYVAATRARDYLIMSAKDRLQKNSWYEMLLESLDTNPGILKCMIRKNQSQVVKQSKWEQTKDEFVAQTVSEEKVAPYTFSVSEIMDFMNDRQKYYESYVLKLHPDWLREEEIKADDKAKADDKQDKFIISATDFGTVVHRACELYDQGFGEDEAVLEAISVLFDDDEIPTNIKEIKLRVMKQLENYKKIESQIPKDHISSEWSFAVEIAGAYIIGEIDKVFIKDGKHSLMDLKTNKTIDTDSYKPQVTLYKMAYEKEMGVEVEEVSLFFMNFGEKGIIKLKPEAAYEKEVEEAIKDMTQLWRSLEEQ